MYESLIIVHFLYASINVVFFFIVGDPPTTVSWWRGGALLSKSSFLEILADRGSLNEPLTCQATNNNISVPLSIAVQLDLICKYIFPLLNLIIFIKNKRSSL